MERDKNKTTSQSRIGMSKSDKQAVEKSLRKADRNHLREKKQKAIDTEREKKQIRHLIRLDQRTPKTTKPEDTIQMTMANVGNETTGANQTMLEGAGKNVKEMKEE